MNTIKFKMTKEYKKALKEVNEINLLGEEISLLSDEELKSKTEYFQNRISNGENLKKIRIEAFAVSREACWRVYKKKPYDVQMIGGIIIDEGQVAEMRTGEGKTLTSVAPVYLNALNKKGVIVSTVNEYLTERDGNGMAKVHNFLGLSVGINKANTSILEKQNSYNQDITYSVHSEIGFDYLKDNMIKNLNTKVQRGFNFVLIDEVDSILIDDAKTPLIISGKQKENSTDYLRTDLFVKTLRKKDYDLDWEKKSIQINDNGIEKANKFFNVENIFSMENSNKIHKVQNALRANYLMFLDQDYIIRESKIEIVDTFTGRVMEGRSFSDGLQQAIQSKEKLEVDPETQTEATITYQNLFRMFPKLSGMTGTAKTEEKEMMEIYNMRVIPIPTNKPILRIDLPDSVFASKTSKYKAMVKDIKKRHSKGQPILVGTEQVSESEAISKLLSKEKLNHKVLNAKQNLSEAEIISQAGNFKAITIATNMAGRGTDIQLTEESKKVGGLYVIGTNRSESRRIDNQLIGRSGRQGDLGSSKFYLSIEDTLMTRFSGFPKLKEKFESFKDDPIPGKPISKFFKNAQIKIEGLNYNQRKDILSYDDVIRQQRDLIYSQRDIILNATDLMVVIERFFISVPKDFLKMDVYKTDDGHLNNEKAAISLNQIWFQFIETKINISKAKKMDNSQMTIYITECLNNAYKEIREKIKEIVGEENLVNVERDIILSNFDQAWINHIDKMSKLRSKSSMASYAQRNPYQVYVEEGTKLFSKLLETISHYSVLLLMTNQYAQTNIAQFREIKEKNRLAEENKKNANLETNNKEINNLDEDK
ncbi:MAG: preprotein translocase subunit SecA [Mollicutes bacterium PWAP]|nr:preprotein translocase subunit SecA [Mollicutes bacterium PWAP]